MWAVSIALCAVLISIWFLWRKKNFSVFKDLGIPGPEPNIIFGNYLELVNENALVCHKEWIDKYGKIFGYFFGAKPVLVVADPDLLKRIQIGDFHKFINRPNIFDIGRRHRSPGDGFSSQLTNIRDKRWKDIRSTISPTFTMSKMKLMAPIINSSIDSLMKNIEDNKDVEEGFDIYKLYQGLTMDVIARTAFGIQTDCQRNPEDPFLKAMKLIFSSEVKRPLFIFAFSFPELSYLVEMYFRFLFLTFYLFGNPIKKLIESVRLIVKGRRESPSNRRQDLLQLLVDAQSTDGDKVTADDLTAGDDNPAEKISTGKSTSSARHMSSDEIVDNSILFLLAGYETTSTALAFTTHFLIYFPEIQERIRDEVKNLIEQEGSLDYSSVQKLQYLDQVMNESLRMYPPIHLFVNREAGEDVQIDKYHIPKGMPVQVPVYTMHHDEEYWQDPETFDPERFSPENKGMINPMAFQAFGAGPRNCIGMRFAQMEFKMTIARILTKYKLLKCDKSDQHPLSLKMNIANITPQKGIFLQVEPL